MAWVGGGSKERSVQGRGDIASEQKGSPFRTLIERKGKLSALFACNAMLSKSLAKLCNIRSLRCSTELVWLHRPRQVPNALRFNEGVQGECGRLPENLLVPEKYVPFVK
ncbi:hypothetical protein Tco_0300601 [Tanacetum coccineum]